jgi:hypothetical protein
MNWSIVTNEQNHTETDLKKHCEHAEWTEVAQDYVQWEGFGIRDTEMFGSITSQRWKTFYMNQTDWYNSKALGLTLRWSTGYLGVSHDSPHSLQANFRIVHSNMPQLLHSKCLLIH